MRFKNVILFLFFLIAFSGFGQGSASSRVEIFEIAAPQLDTLKTIRLYLPKGYETSKERYPVIYMHDAQNLFDTLTAFSGEWQVDEFLDTQKGQKVIVVGIDHGNEKRIAELTPFPHEIYGGGEAEAYLNFLVQTLKPHIDSSYRTLPKAENTAIFGSSLGGLVSFYAILKHSEIFGKAGVFSPSFWFSEKIYDFTEGSNLNKNFKIYILGGTAEGESLIPDIRRMEQLLLKKGLPPKKLKIKIVEGGEHNEGFWRAEFPAAFNWLFSARM